MATTKAILAEQVMRFLAGGNLKPDRNIDIREVMLYVDQCRDDMCRQSVFESIKRGEYDIDADFLTYYDSVTIETDSVRAMKYITLPAARVSLPKDMGIYQISPAENQADLFIPIKAGQLWMYRDTQTFLAELNTYYFSVGNKVYFSNIDDAITEVMLVLVAASSSFSQDAVYPIPSDYEKIIIDTVLERFGVHKQIPHDEIEDGNK